MDILEKNFNFTLDKNISGPVLSAFYALIMVTGLVANLFVIIVTFCHPKSLKKPSTIFLTSLLLADLVLVVLVMPFSVISTASGEWIFGQSTKEKYGVCKFVGFMLWYGALLVTATLAIVSFDRCLSIVKPFIHKQYMKPHTAVIIVVIAWIILAVLNTTPFYGFGIFSYGSDQGTCTPDWSEQVPYLSFFVVIFLIMIVTIVVTSIWTCCFTRRFLEQHQSGSNIYVNKNRKLIGIFGSLLLACALCFGPALITAIVTIFTYVPFTSAISIFCFFCITVANPLIQSFFRPDVRDTFKYMFSKCLSHTPSDHVLWRMDQQLKCLRLQFNFWNYYYIFSISYTCVSIYL